MFDINITYFVFIGLFLLFVLVFKTSVLNPMSKILADRQSLIQENLNLSEKLKLETTELNHNFDAKIQEAKHNAKAIVTEAMEKANKENTELIDKAVKQSRSTIDNTKAMLLSDKDKLISSLVPEVKDLAKKILKAVLTEADLNSLSFNQADILSNLTNKGG